MGWKGGSFHVKKKIKDGIITLGRGDLGGMEPGGCG